MAKSERLTRDCVGYRVNRHGGHFPSRLREVFLQARGISIQNVDTLRKITFPKQNCSVSIRSTWSETCQVAGQPSNWVGVSATGYSFLHCSHQLVCFHYTGAVKADIFAKTIHVCHQLITTPVSRIWCRKSWPATQNLFFAFIFGNQGSCQYLVGGK